MTVARSLVTDHMTVVLMTSVAIPMVALGGYPWLLSWLLQVPIAVDNGGDSNDSIPMEQNIFSSIKEIQLTILMMNTILIVPLLSKSEKYIEHAT